MKKILSILLAVLCIVGCGAIAFAEGEEYDYSAYDTYYCDENGNLKYGIGYWDFIYCQNSKMIADIGYNKELDFYYCNICDGNLSNNHVIYDSGTNLAYGYICPLCGGFCGISHISFAGHEEDRINNPGEGVIFGGHCYHCDEEIGYVKNVKLYRFTSEAIKSEHIPAFENTEYMYGDGKDMDIEEIVDSDSGGVYRKWKKGYYNSFQYKVATFFKNLIENIRYFFSRLFSF